jgi:hypothetical protein
MLLRERKLLSLDDTLTTHLPDGVVQTRVTL